MLVIDMRYANVASQAALRPVGRNRPARHADGLPGRDRGRSQRQITATRRARTLTDARRTSRRGAQPVITCGSGSHRVLSCEGVECQHAA